MNKRKRAKTPWQHSSRHHGESPGREKELQLHSFVSSCAPVRLDSSRTAMAPELQAEQPQTGQVRSEIQLCALRAALAEAEFEAFQTRHACEEATRVHRDSWRCGIRIWGLYIGPRCIKRFMSCRVSRVRWLHVVGVAIPKCMSSVPGPHSPYLAANPHHKRLPRFQISTCLGSSRIRLVHLVFLKPTSARTYSEAIVCLSKAVIRDPHLDETSYGELLKLSLPIATVMHATFRPSKIDPLGVRHAALSKKSADMEHGSVNACRV